MYKLITLLFAWTICSMSGFAQKKQKDTVKKYLDSRLAFTNKANAEFPALAIKTSDHWLLAAAYQDTNLLLKAWFLDEELTVKDGPFTIYHPQKIKMAEGSYVNNIKQGVWKTWYENGRLKDSGAFKNNHMTGEWRLWNDSGQLTGIYHYTDLNEITSVARGTMSDERRPSIFTGDTIVGRMHGTATTFYPDGKLKASGSYKSNSKDGMWKYWYSNGNLESRGTYITNIQEGEWEYYRESGTLSSKEKYVKNKVTALECFDEQGNFSGNSCAILKPPVALGKFIDFDKYALDNMFWPAPLKRADIQGDVQIEYTISKEGELKDLKVLFSPHQLMSDEVLRFFRTLKWSPAVSHNRPIEYTMKYKVPFYR